MKYPITIIETLSRTITVEAVNQDEAIEEVKRQYKDGDIILCADDFSEVIFKEQSESNYA